jgi:hypothetical protein
MHAVADGGAPPSASGERHDTSGGHGIAFWRNQFDETFGQPGAFFRFHP